MPDKSFFITGGGTGGHIYPAVAIADLIIEKFSDAKLYYVGNPHNMEAGIVKLKPYVFLPVVSSGMPRKLGVSCFLWFVRMFLATVKCCYYILKYKPSVVFGTGGYVSAPVLCAAKFLRIPFVMHDCDVNPGLVTRKLAPFAKSVSVAFESAKDKLDSDRVFVNGNPIRREFSTVTKAQAREKLGLGDKLTLCVMGGSQGAKTINSAVSKVIKSLIEKYDIQVIFQTGKKNYDETLKELKIVWPEFEDCKNLIVKPYFSEMVYVLAASDIAVSRAGSLSISEICSTGLAAIFIPYPYAAADHQRKNAKFMEEKGAGVYLEDSDASSQRLYDEIVSLITDISKLDSISNCAKSLAKNDAAERILSQIIGE